MENKENIDLINKTTTADETLKDFEDFYDIVVSNRVNLTVLETLFNNFANLTYKHTKSYKVIINKQTKITDILLPTLTKRQKILFEKYDILLNEELQDYGLQCFITGALLSSEINSEMNDFYNNCDNLKGLVNYLRQIKKDQSN